MSVCVIYLFLLFESSWVSGITSSSLLHLFCNCHNTNSILDMYFQLSQYLENWINTLSWCKSSFLHSSMTWCDRRVTSTGSSSFWTWFHHMLAIWPGLSCDSLCSRHLDTKVNTIGSTVKNPPTSLVSSATFSGLCWDLNWDLNKILGFVIGRKNDFFICLFPLQCLTPCDAPRLTVIYQNSLRKGAGFHGELTETPFLEHLFCLFARSKCWLGETYLLGQRQPQAI